MRSSVAACIALILLGPIPARAYMKFGVQVGNRQVELKWAQSPVRYFVSDRGAPGVSANDLQGVVSRAFTKWQDVATASVTYQFAGFTAALPLDEDGLSTIGFAPRPDLDRVLAATNFLFDTSTGELLESDIFFNTAFSWSVAQSGEAGRYDLESIALHEEGHFSGLGHSALGETEVFAGSGRRVIGAEAVMFPIAFSAGSIVGRTLRADDIAGISHIAAFNPKTGELVGNFSLNDEGRFGIEGLAPGPYVIRVEPLDDADPESFFESDKRVDVNFRVTFFDRLVVAPSGGSSGDIEIKVLAK
jgi:Matrixin